MPARPYRLLFACAALVGAAGLRAQITESPVTVAPGHFLFETDVVAVTSDRAGGARFDGLGLVSTLVTTGVTETWDVQLGAQIYVDQRFEDEGVVERRRGVGDVYLRTKWHCHDDAATGTSLALMPYVKAPTNSGRVGNDAWEGGLIVPVTFRCCQVDVGAMAELDIVRNADDNGYGTYCSATITAGRQFTSRFGAYAEAAAGKSSTPAPWAGIVGLGLTYTVSDRVQWDLATYRGVTSGAADWNHVLRLNLSF